MPGSQGYKLQQWKHRRGAHYSSTAAGPSAPATDSASSRSFVRSSGTSTDAMMNREQMTIAIFPGKGLNAFHNLASEADQSVQTIASQYVTTQLTEEQRNLLDELKRTTEDEIPDYDKVESLLTEFNTKSQNDGVQMVMGDPSERYDLSKSTAYQKKKMHRFRISPSPTETWSNDYHPADDYSHSPQTVTLRVWKGPNEIRVLSANHDIPLELHALPSKQLSALYDLCIAESSSDQAAFENGMKNLTSLNESGKPQIQEILRDEYDAYSNKYNDSRVYACSHIVIKTVLHRSQEDKWLMRGR